LKKEIIKLLLLFIKYDNNIIYIIKYVY